MDKQSLQKLNSLGLLPPSLSFEEAVQQPAFEIVPSQSVNVQKSMDGATSLSNAKLQVQEAREPVHLTPRKLELFLVLLVIGLAIAAHATNMLHYPYYENDEGTYISQAWSLLKNGSLSPYTYWYDHAPAGWFFIALWTKLVGGFFTFGTSIDTGRVFMMVVRVLSAVLIYGIGKRLAKGKVLPGFIAAVLFSLSPLAIYFGRRVLLDNMMVFWVLLSLWLVLAPKLKLRSAVASAVLFGVAILTKETAIFFFPAFLFAAWFGLHRSHRLFGMSLYVTITGLVVSLYPLYALLKSEFFPDSWFGSARHVSLIETLKFQAGRGAGLPFWNVNSDLYQNALEWLQRDPVLVIAGSGALVLATLLAYKRAEFRMPLVFAAGMLYFLLRGGLIINFYILPLIPFLVLLIGLVVSLWLEKLSSFFVSVLWSKNPAFIYSGGAAAVLILAGTAMLANSGGLYTQDEATPMKDAITWTKSHINPGAVMIVDNAIFVDLRESRFAGDPAFTRAEWFWKVEKDPDVFKKNIGGDWLNVQYVLLSHEMVRQISDYQITLTKEILPHASLLTGWSGGGAFVDLSKFISTNGDWMRVYEVHTRPVFALETLWQADKGAYIQNYGQVVSESKQTTAALQGEAMLRAALIGDKSAFEGLWAWTHDHMQHRTGDMLLSENPQGNNPDYEAYLSSNQKIATALLVAGSKWNSAEYTNAGAAVASDIWNKLGLTIDGQTVLAASTKQDEEQSRFQDTGVLAPASYRLFAKADEAHAWNVLADEAYSALPSATGAASFSTVSKTGKVLGSRSAVFDITELTYNIALDAQWFKSEKAVLWLSQNKPQLEVLAATNGAGKLVVALYYAETITNPDVADKTYTDLIASYFNRNSQSWNKQGLTLEEKTDLWNGFSLSHPDLKLLALLNPSRITVASE